MRVAPPDWCSRWVLPLGAPDRVPRGPGGGPLGALRRVCGSRRGFVPVYRCCIPVGGSFFYLVFCSREGVSWCICVHIYTYIYIYIIIYVYISECIYIYGGLRSCLWHSTPVRGFLVVSMYTYIYLYIYILVHICIYVYIYAYTGIYRYIFAYIWFIFVYMYICVYMYILVYICIYLYIFVYIAI